MTLLATCDSYVVAFSSNPHVLRQHTTRFHHTVLAKALALANSREFRMPPTAAAAAAALLSVL
jgi:hypothetical protein